MSFLGSRSVNIDQEVRHARLSAIAQVYKIVDANGQSLAYVYGHADPRDAEIAKGLTLDEAKRIASNIAKLPSLLGKTERPPSMELGELGCSDTGV
jgi:hypothetical protein